MQLPLALRTARGILRRHHPDYLIYYATYECNLNCPHCFNRSLRASHCQEAPLTVPELIRIAASLRPMLHLLVSGGEPFLRDDLEDVISAFIIHARVRFVGIPTNGTLTSRLLSSMTGLLGRHPHVRFNLNLSIDGLESHHDLMCGRPGAFGQLLATAEALQPLRVRFNNLGVTVLSVMNRTSYPGLEELKRFVTDRIRPDYHDVGIERAYFSDPTQQEWVEARLAELGRYAGSQTTAGTGSIQRTVAGMQLKVMGDVLKYRRMTFPCLAGRKMAVVTPGGLVYPCEPLWLEKERFPALRDYRIGSFRVADCSWSGIRRTDQYRAITELIHRRFCHCTWECAIFNSIQYNPWFALEMWRRLHS
ncbi:radical SAM protein [bacterium]|nr:radical SAM protein [candidate division CSSED10-310 bacterium]